MSLFARRPRGRPAWAAATALIAACASNDDFVANEGGLDAEIRIVLTRGRSGPRFEVLTQSEPFQIAPSALSAELEDGGALQIWVFAFRQADLVNRFPGLAGRSTLDVVVALEPVLEPEGPGRYAPPDPVAVLRTTLTEDTDREVRYDPVDWASTRGDPTTAFTLALGGALACPPVDQPFRVFVRDRPERACIYRRDDACRWVTEGCPHASIFGDNGNVREEPAGTLFDGELVCRRVPAQNEGLVRGETDAWDCGDRVVAAQRQVDRLPGVPWALDVTRSLTNEELARPRRWAIAATGAWLAVDGGLNDIRLRRVLIDETAPSYQPTGIPLPDDGLGREVSSVDGLLIELEEDDFKFSVGLGIQCLRLFDTNNRRRFYAIQTTSSNTLTLRSPGIGQPLPRTSRWAVAGEPGQIDTTEPPGQEELRLPGDVGQLVALSLTEEQSSLLVQGTNKTYRIPRITDLDVLLNIFGCPVEIPHPAGLVGSIVVAGQDHLALVRNGVVRLDADGRPTASSTVADAVFDGSYRLERRAGADGFDRALVFQPNESLVWVFAPNAPPTVVDLAGPVVGTLNGPQVIIQTGANTFAVRDIVGPANAPAVTYHVPAFSTDETSPVVIRPEAVINFRGSTLVGLSQGRYVGVLDLRSGLSQGFRADPGVFVETVLSDEGSQALWLVARTRETDNTLLLVQVPEPLRAAP